MNEENYDEGRQEWVPPGDGRYIDEKQRQNLQALHEQAKSKPWPAAKAAAPKAACQDKSAATAQPPATQVTESVLQVWLDRARTEEMEPNSQFLRHIVNLRCSLTGEVKKRYPFETANFTVPNQDQKMGMEVHQRTDVVWCAMLYGSGEKVMNHLKACLMLGQMLRFEVAPLLESMGQKKMTNVLFVTETSLHEDAFRAVSMLWSVQFVTLPKVCPQRLAATSAHLLAAGCSAEHVYLKSEAWKMDAELSIISDLDVVMTSAKVITTTILDFLGEGAVAKEFGKAKAAVMQRKCSEVVSAREPYRMTQREWSMHHFDQGSMPVSYCYAILKPGKDVSEDYEKMMTEPTPQRNGILSDQVLLSEMISDNFLLMTHTFIAFPSWWCHYDIWKVRAREIMTWYWNKIDDGVVSWKDIGAKAVEDFGAVHLSKSFDFVTNAETTEMKRKSWQDAMAVTDPSEIFMTLGRTPIACWDFLNFMEGFWVALWEENERQRLKLWEITMEAVGTMPPRLGLAKMIVCLQAVPKTVIIERKRKNKPAASHSWQTKAKGRGW